MTMFPPTIISKWHQIKLFLKHTKHHIFFIVVVKLDFLTIRNRRKLLGWLKNDIFDNI